MFCLAYQHNLLPVWSRKVLPLIGSQVGCYHEGSRGRSGFRDPNSSRGPVKPEGVQRGPEWSAQGQRRVSSELRRLSQDDFTEDGQKKARQTPASEDLEVVFGVAPCLLALRRGHRKAQKLYVKDGEASVRVSVVKVCEEARRQGIRVQRVSKKQLDRMCDGNVHQGVCLQASPLGYLSQDSAPSREHHTLPLWLILDRIQDPMNLGAILRSAYFLGVDRVASSLRHSCPLSPVVSKASSGVMEVMEVYGYSDLGEVVRSKAAQGWQVVGTVGSDFRHSQIPITRCSEFRMTKATLLLMGGEGTGLSEELLSLCQTLLTIPTGRELSPGIESLNVSVATGILLHSLLTSRRTD